MNLDVLRSVLTDAQRIGLLGPQPVDQHINHARSWADGLEPAPFLDLGSGAGVPGLVFAVLWPDVPATLLDGQIRRTAWLRTAAARLGIDHRIRVAEGRAEELAIRPELREQFPLVVARGFGPPASAAECGSGFLRLQGLLSISEPPSPEPDRWPKDGLARIGLETHSQVVHPDGSFVILRKFEPLDANLPRQRNLPLRKPLW